MIQGITFRLHDAVPSEVIQKWKDELELSAIAASAGGLATSSSRGTSAAEPAALPAAKNAATAKATALPGAEAAAADLRLIELARRIARYEDAGHGACWLRDVRIGQLVESNLLHFDAQRYRLLAWCVMPNHVHVLLETRELWPLADVVHSWKSYTAHEANRILGRHGELWQREYHDRYIRNAEHYLRAIQYIEGNPVKARLVESPTEWPWSSARFRTTRSTAGSAARSQQQAGGPRALPVEPDADNTTPSSRP